MKFNTAQQMLDYINSNHDLYSPKAEIYVFNYNDAGSIATYHITKDEARELSNKVKSRGEDYWAAFLGVGGSIWDDPSHEFYQEGQTSNLERCEELLEFEDWILTEDYPESTDTANKASATVGSEDVCSVNYMKLCAYLPTDNAPFTGEKQMIPPVRVRLKFLPERYFSKTSMLGESREEYLERMKSDGIQLHKTYEAIRINGYGDVADIIVLNDFGEEKPFMAFLFRDDDEFLGE